MHRPQSRQIAVRLDEGLLAQLDEHAVGMGMQHPGVRFTRVDAMRELLALALERVAVAKQKGEIAR